MKIELICHEEKRDSLSKELIARGFKIVDKSEFVFLDKSLSEKQYIFAKDDKKNISLIEYDKIIYFESFNKITEVISADGRFEVKEKLYELEKILYLKDFVRVNKSTIINLLKVEKIIPWIGSKFILDMKDGSQIEVTRTYFSYFKKRLGI